MHLEELIQFLLNKENLTDHIVSQSFQALKPQSMHDDICLWEYIGDHLHHHEFFLAAFKVLIILVLLLKKMTP